MFATCYLTLFLTSITNVALMREFLQHLVTGRHDDRSVMASLIENIASSNHRVGGAETRGTVRIVWWLIFTPFTVSPSPPLPPSPPS